MLFSYYFYSTEIKDTNNISKEEEQVTKIKINVLIVWYIHIFLILLLWML